MKYAKIGQIKMTPEIIELICELERIIGGECYNPNSVNGYTWEEGCQFRYPVCYEDKENDWTARGIISNIDKLGIETMKYKFGSNHLYIGKALVMVLERLEEKYGLNFAKLAKENQ